MKIKSLTVSRDNDFVAEGIEEDQVIELIDEDFLFNKRQGVSYNDYEIEVLISMNLKEYKEFLKNRS